MDFDHLNHCGGDEGGNGKRIPRGLAECLFKLVLG